MIRRHGQFDERRINDGDNYPVGDIPDYGKGKSEEREEIDFNGLLQQSLTWLSTAGSCYLSRFQCLRFRGEEFRSSPGRF